MLLGNNSEKVIDLVNYFDDLLIENKIRLVILLIEDSNFKDIFKEEIIYCLKEILFNLNYANNTLINLSKNKMVVFFLAMYMELSKKEKNHFLLEILFNIYSSKFESQEIREFIDKNLKVYEYYYELFNNKEL